MRGIAGVADALEAAVAVTAGLPAFDAADVELAVFGVHAGTHDAGVEFEIEGKDAALGDFVLADLFIHDEEERGFAVAGVEEVIGEWAEAPIGDEALAAGGVVLVHGDPADGWLVALGDGN